MTKTITCPKCGSDNIALNTRYVGKDLRRVTLVWDEDTEQFNMTRSEHCDVDEPESELSRHLFCWDCDTNLPADIAAQVWDDDLKQDLTAGEPS